MAKCEHWASNSGEAGYLIFRAETDASRICEKFHKPSFPRKLQPLFSIFRGIRFHSGRYNFFPLRKRAVFFESQPPPMQGKKSILIRTPLLIALKKET